MKSAEQVFAHPDSGSGGAHNHGRAKYFKSNLNSTLSSLRRQLTTSGYAVARTLLNGEPVWGLALCREYVSVPDCLNCFDYAAVQLRVCGKKDGQIEKVYGDDDVLLTSQIDMVERVSRVERGGSGKQAGRPTT
ncbi:hypothetical protein L1987_74621 [Smallanthus sonchifolius]|uniref:Uncharacterized protein n=1 Tax=Smallanthus sonchifolius TaxID=185202 RepID=A0ACB9A2Q2_9ASTR|nr:hypothetical protein L1987_74621 [Smallanthus sonchifolius]